MNRLLLIATLLLFSFSSVAQSAPQFRIKSIARHQYNWSNTWDLTDTLSCFYTADKPGLVTWQIADAWSHTVRPFFYAQPSLNYDSASGAISEFLPNSKLPHRITQTFDAQGRLDTFKLYRTATTPLLVKAETFNYSGNDLAEWTRTSYGSPSQTKTIYRYKNGVLDSMIRKGSQNDTTVYFYNSSGQLTKSEQYYMYTGAPTYIQKHTVLSGFYSYNTNNQLTEIMMYSSYYPDTLVLEKYSYNTAGDVEVKEVWSRRTYTAADSDLVFHEKYEYVYDANHKKLEEKLTYWNNLPALRTVKRSYTYNTYGLLSYLELKKWDNNQWISGPDTTPILASHYFDFSYELYWPTGVEIKAGQEHDVKLYPSPAGDFISIETEWNEALPFDAAIYDMQGAVTRNWREPAAKTYKRTVPVTELPAGIYILQLRCGDQVAIKRFVIDR
jgi:hypothetical protein